MRGPKLWQGARELSRPHGDAFGFHDIVWDAAAWDFASASDRRAEVLRSNPNVGAVRIGGKEA